MRFSLASAPIPYTPSKPAKSLARGERNATVIAVAAQKGGVGKTTTSVSLASALARFHDRRVLVVDLDPQSHVNLALREQVEMGGGSLADLLTDPSGLEVEEIATDTRIPNLRVTPAAPQLAQAENRLSSRIGKELVLREALEITRTHYDIILLDCPPNLGNLTLNGLVAADSVLVPCNPAALAVSGVEGLLRAVGEIRGVLNPALDVLGLVLTRVDGRNAAMNAAILELLGQNWGGLLLPVQIGVDSALPRAQMAGTDVFGFEPASRAAEQYRALATCVLERLATGG